MQQGDPQKDVLFLNSFFFSQLKEGGPDSVANFTSGKKTKNAKKIDVFAKRLVFIIINADLHWSLVVLVNPGQVFDNKRKEKSDKVDASFLLHLDSLGAHDGKKIASNLYDWLNHQAKIAQTKISGAVSFNTRTLPLCTPPIPQQKNGYDCGVFVCRYFEGFWELQENTFTATKSSFAMKKERDEIVCNWISHHPSFKFDGETILQMRTRIRKLILQLGQQRKEENKEDEGDSNKENNKDHDLSTFKVIQLRKMCRIQGVKNWSQMRKAEMIEALQIKYTGRE